MKEVIVGHVSTEGVINQSKHETESPRKEIDRRKDDPVDSRTMLANTKLFLERLPDSDPDSRRYIEDIKETIENRLHRESSAEPPPSEDCER